MCGLEMCATERILEELSLSLTPKHKMVYLSVFNHNSELIGSRSKMSELFESYTMSMFNFTRYYQTAFQTFSNYL